MRTMIETDALNDAERSGDPYRLPEESFNRFAQYITRELGIKMPDSKLPMIQSRLLRRLRELKLDSWEAYSEYFFQSSHEEERDHFISAITTNKTDFFREPSHFQFLTGTALPSLPGAKSATFRVHAWSAGCSSGEEPYTLAMVLNEYGRTRRGFDFAVLGTDISPRVLGHARKGIYTEAVVAPVPAEYRQKYLMRSRDLSQKLVRVSALLREKVSFHRLNFMEDHYPVKDRFDVIFFRNVMIYFDRRTQEAVVNKLCRSLNPGGYLFVGHSESLVDMDIPVRPVAAAVFRMPE